MNENVELARGVFLNVDKTKMNPVDAIKTLIRKMRDKRIFFKSVPISGYESEKFSNGPDILKLMIRYDCKFYDYSKFIATRDVESAEYLWSSEVYYERLLLDDLSTLEFFDIEQYYSSRMFMSSQYMAVFYEWALTCGGNLFLVQMEKRVPYQRPPINSSVGMKEAVEIFKKVIENSGVTMKITSKNTLIANARSFSYDDLVKSAAFQYMLSGFQMNLAFVKQVDLSDKIQDWLGTLTPPSESVTDGAAMSSILNVTAQLANKVRDLDIVKEQIAQTPPPVITQLPAIAEPEQAKLNSELPQQVALISQKADLEKSIAALTSQLAAVNPVVVQASEFDTILASITALLKKIDDTNKKINSGQSSTNILQERDMYRQQASDMIAKLSGSVSYETTVNLLKSQISNLEKSLENEKAISANSSKSLITEAEYKKRLEDSQLKVTQLQAEIEKKNSQLLAVNSMGTQATSLSVEMEKRYNDIVKVKADLESQLKESTAKAIEMNDEITNLKKKIIDNEAALKAPLNTSLAAALESSQDFQKSKELILIEIDRYKLKLEDERKKQQELQIKIDAKNKEIEGYKKDINLKSKVIDALQLEKQNAAKILMDIGYNNLSEGYLLVKEGERLKGMGDDILASMTLLPKYFSNGGSYSNLSEQEATFLNKCWQYPFKEWTSSTPAFNSLVRWTGKYRQNAIYYNEMRLLCSEAGNDPLKMAKAIELITNEMKELARSTFFGSKVRGYAVNAYTDNDKYLYWQQNSSSAPILIIDSFGFRNKEQYLASNKGINIFPSMTISGKRWDLISLVEELLNREPQTMNRILMLEAPNKGIFKNKGVLSTGAEQVMLAMWHNHDTGYDRIEMINNYFVALWNLRKGMAHKLIALYKPNIQTANLDPDTVGIRLAVAGMPWIQTLINEVKELDDFAAKAKAETDRINNELKVAASQQEKIKQLTEQKNPYSMTTRNFKNVVLGTNHPTITPEILSALIDLDSNLMIFTSLELNFGNIKTIRAYTEKARTEKWFADKFYTPKLMDNKLNLVMVYNDSINAGTSGPNYFDQNKFMTFFIDALSRYRVCFSLVIPKYNPTVSKTIFNTLVKYNPNLQFSFFDSNFKQKGLYIGSYVRNAESLFTILDACLGFYFYDETAWIQIARSNPEKYTVTADSPYEWGNHLTSFHYMHMETLRILFKPNLGLDIFTNYDSWINTQQILYEQFAIAYYMKEFARDFRWVAITPVGELTYPIFATPASKTVMVEDLIGQFHVKTMKYMGVSIALRNSWEIDTSDSLEVYISPYEQLYSILYYLAPETRTHPFFKKIGDLLEVDHFYYGCLKATAPFRRLRMSWWSTKEAYCGADGSPYVPIPKQEYLDIMENWEKLPENEKAKYKETSKLGALMSRSSKYLEVIREILRGATKIASTVPWSPAYLQMGLSGLLPLLFKSTVNVDKDKIVEVIKNSKNHDFMCLYAPEASMAMSNFLDQFAGKYAELFLYTLEIVGNAPLCGGNMCDCIDRGGVMAMGSTQGDTTNSCYSGVKSYCYIPKYRTPQFDALVQEYKETCKEVTVQTALHNMAMQKAAMEIVSQAATIGLKAVAA